MHKVEENDIGALLAKMRDRQHKIRQSLDHDVLRFSRKQQPSIPRLSQCSTNSSSSASSFEHRLERIQVIRKKFEQQYSILRNPNAKSMQTNKQMDDELSASLQTLTRPQSADSSELQRIQSSATSKSDQNVSSPSLQRPSTADPELVISSQTTTSHTTNQHKSVSVDQLQAPPEPVTKKPEMYSTQKLTTKQAPSRRRSKSAAKTAVSKSDSYKHNGNISENLLFEVFLYLDAVTLGQMCPVSDSWHCTILQTVRYMFSIPFKSYPSPSKLPNKTIFLTLKKLHFLDARSCGELLFWSCARGYSAFLEHFIANIDRGEIELVLPPIRYGINAVSKIDNMTALHIACKHNQLQIVKLLLSHSTIDVNKLTKSGKHALIIAAQRNHTGIIDQLMQHADLKVNQIDSEQKSLLHITCSMGHTHTVHQLLTKGANPNVVDKENRTPLYIAAENGYLDICKCLLTANISDSDNETESSNKVDIHLASKSGKSPLYAASENGHLSVVSYLLQKGANVRQETCRGKIPLYAAAEKQYAKIVKEILPYTQERDLFKLTHYGTTAMFIASKQSNKTVKKMLVAFCVHQKQIKQQQPQLLQQIVHDEPQESESERNRKQSSVDSEDIDGDSHEEDRSNADWVNALQGNNHYDGQRLGTPKFSEHYETFQELQHKRKRKSFSKTTPFLERLANVMKIEQAANNDEEEEEKQKSVPRVMDSSYQRERTRRRSHRSSYHKRHRVNPERKDEDEMDFDPNDDGESSQPAKSRKTSFDYNRLYKGTLRNKSQSEESSMEQSEISGNNNSDKEQKWRGFSDRFIMRNLTRSNQANDESEDVDPDEILQQDEAQQIEKQKEKINREAAARFLQRQKEKVMEAQQKAKERINHYKQRDIQERQLLLKKREQARSMALKVAEKIAKRQQYEEKMERQRMESTEATDTQSDNIEKLLKQEDETDVASNSKVQLETQSDPCLNLFDKLRKKGIMNENFQQNANEDGMRLNSHRSLTTLDKAKQQRKRSLEVTGRILKVLSSRKSHSSNGRSNSLTLDEGLQAIEDEMNMQMEDNGDGFLTEVDEICFLHPLSKKQRKKLRRDRLEQAYGIKPGGKKKKKKAASVPAADSAKSATELNCLLQIASINPLNRQS